MVSLAQLGIDLESIKDSRVREAIILLFNLIEEISSENQNLRTENQRLCDEIALLKGEQKKPTIQGRNKKQSGNISSEEERRGTEKERRNKSSKNEKLQITRTEVIRVDRANLPQDAEFKGYETITVQDIVIKTEVIEFQKEVFYSPSLKKTFSGKLPAGFQGTFGPRLKALIILLKTVGNMTEPKITELLTSFNVQIAASSIDRILGKKQDVFHTEKEAIFTAGLTSSRYQHIDDTSHRQNGENYHTHVVCNPWYSAYFTTEKKDRLTVLDILNFFAPRVYLFNQETYRLLKQMRVSDVISSKLRQIAKDGFLTQEQIDTMLESSFCFLQTNQLQRTRILESAVISAYHAQTERPIIQILIADDAPQFKLLTKELALCWIHDGRHYKKLRPAISHNQAILQNFLTRYWNFYRKLLIYKQDPTTIMAEELAKEFDELFTTQTDYQELNKRIAKTRAKKQELLLVLTYPEISLHNNPAELGARAQVRKRDVSLHTRTTEGTKVQDTFLTIVETAKKLQVNIYDYILDRLRQTYTLPSLATLIREKSIAYNHTILEIP